MRNNNVDQLSSILNSELDFEKSGFYLCTGYEKCLELRAVAIIPALAREGRPACTDCTHSGQQTSDWKYFYNLEQQPTPSALCSVRAMSVSADLIYRSDAGAGAVAFTQSLAILIIYEVSTLYIT